ncbi:MAG: tRNA threonylcarbamoyladenosine dehydratase [Bacteroidales bacterium]|nr:tRNA threonylcarbamoyladenosine dehydratase [Bacteroidales bacterium]MDD5974834.1 tRNA threonylcarbamoyladenosine dehydratase [Bacteroidales bacterium]
MDNWCERTELMFGSSDLEKLKSANILIVGVGGVGAYAAEMLVRAGVGNITIVDADKVSLSNCNRQLVALHSTVGKSKVDVLAERLSDINPELKINKIEAFIKDEFTVELLAENNFSFIVDAIDTLAPKVFLLAEAVKRGIPVVSSMGSGGKLNPAMVKIDDISKSDYCKLARMVRKRLHRLGIRKGITVVYSAEVVPPERIIETVGEQNKKSNVGTVSYMPAIFGCYIASYVIRYLTNNL